MTSSSLASLDGRTVPGANTTGRRRLALPTLRRRSGAVRSPSARRRRDRREEGDAYLDRTGLSSVDWLDGLTRQVQR